MAELDKEIFTKTQQVRYLRHKRGSRYHGRVARELQALLASRADPTAHAALVAAEEFHWEVRRRNDAEISRLQYNTSNAYAVVVQMKHDLTEHGKVEFASLDAARVFNTEPENEFIDRLKAEVVKQDGPFGFFNALVPNYLDQRGVDIAKALYDFSFVLFNI